MLRSANRTPMKLTGFFMKRRSSFFLAAAIIFTTLAVLYGAKVDKKLLARSDYFAARVSINNMLGLSSDRIRVDGDSMVAGINLDIPTKTVIQAYSWGDDFPEADIHGNSGAHLEVVLSELMQAKPVKVKAVIIFAGFNNIKHSDQTPEAIAAKYAGLFHRAKLISDNVLCIAVPPMVHEKSTLWYPEGDWINSKRIHAVNKGINEICGLGFVDTESFWTNQDSDDGIHPNRSGYYKIASEVRKKLGNAP